jgi:hypothetical protein
MDGTVSIGSITPSATSIKPTVRRVTPAWHARQMSDVRMLKVRVSGAAALSDELIDWGAGNRNGVHELECALLNPEFAFTQRERADIETEIDSCRALEIACRDELAELSSWTDLAKCSSWKELAQEAARRDSIA